MYILCRTFDGNFYKQNLDVSAYLLTTCWYTVTEFQSSSFSGGLAKWRLVLRRRRHGVIRSTSLQANQALNLEISFTHKSLHKYPGVAFRNAVIRSKNRNTTQTSFKRRGQWTQAAAVVMHQRWRSRLPAAAASQTRSSVDANGNIQVIRG